MVDGIVLETRNGESRFHARLLDNDQVWFGFSRGGLPLTPDTLAFARLAERGVLVTQAASNWSSWDVSDDLSTLTTMAVDDIVEINGTVTGDRHEGAEPAVATFRLLRKEDVTVGDCTYGALSFGAKIAVTKPDGSVDTLPGHFAYLPDLQIALAGMWDGGLRNVTNIRKATADDWFGDE